MYQITYVLKNKQNMEIIDSFVILIFFLGLSSQNENTSLENNSMHSGNYSYDQQIVGFNGTKILSGPIVLADKRTLFITDLLIQDIPGDIELWVGIGNPENGTQSQYIQSINASVNFTNMYVTLPEEYSLDVIDYFQAKSLNETLSYVLIPPVIRSEVRDYDPQNMEDSVFRVPKCCSQSKYLNLTTLSCSEAKRNFNLEVTIFESNATGLDPNITLSPSSYRLVPYYRNLYCKENGLRIGVDEADIHGLIFNSSLVIEGTGILSHGDYCVDVLAADDREDETITLYCLYTSPEDPNVYLPVLVISAICFLLSTLAYGFILKSEDIHHICFTLFVASMFFAFMSLIIMQVQNDEVTCNAIGFIFILTTSLSFIWLLISCLELLYLVRTPIEKDRYKERWYYYCGVTVGVSLLILCVSLFSPTLFVPDVPMSFIMNYSKNRCHFQTTTATLIIFFPMIVSCLLSIMSLVALPYYMKKNENDQNIKNHCDWVDNSNNYKFLSRTYGIIIAVACFWPCNIFFEVFSLENGKTQLAFDVIKACLGIVTFIGFVGNKYTRKEITERFLEKRRITDKTIDLQNIPTPDTPIENDPLLAHNFNGNDRGENRSSNNVDNSIS